MRRRARLPGPVGHGRPGGLRQAQAPLLPTGEHLLPPGVQKVETMMTRAQIMKLAGTNFYNPKLVAKCKWKQGQGNQCQTPGVIFEE